MLAYKNILLKVNTLKKKKTISVETHLLKVSRNSYYLFFKNYFSIFFIYNFGFDKIIMLQVKLIMLCSFHYTTSSKKRKEKKKGSLFQELHVILLSWHLWWFFYYVFFSKNFL